MAQNTFDFAHFWSNLSTILANKQATLTTAQQNAADSGITASKVTQYDKDSAALTEVIDGGAKNLLDPSDACGYNGQGAAFPIVVGGVTFTLNSDGTISTSGRSTSASAPRVLRIPLTLAAGSYHFSGCPANGSSSSYRIDLREPGTDTFVTQTMDEGTGLNVTFSATTSLDVCLRIAANYDTNAVFSPMVSTAAAWSISQDFVKYCPSMAELYAMIKALQAAT